MDKHTQQELCWALFMICSLLGLWSVAKGWVTGEVNRSRTGSFKFQKLTRENDPSKFQLYMIAMTIMNVVFFLGICLWGFVIFR